MSYDADDLCMYMEFTWNEAKLKTKAELSTRPGMMKTKRNHSPCQITMRQTHISAHFAEDVERGHCIGQ